MQKKQLYATPEVDVLEVQIEETILESSPGAPGPGNGYNDYPDDF